ncbi:cation:proton antiporter [Streptomyces sp. NBC_00859]|uniref:cation:proton antiporter n=1 Tax=Streptomyces sp. NBC_00859 TaxID=2903682 RepID=UPI003867AED1|nr:monovalent cation/H(+) antiporter subunit G [Streptomyces sp. NBC_00859]
MDIRQICAVALMCCGSAALVLSVLALLVLPGPYARLHALAPATSLGLPLICLALAVDAGPGRTAVKFLFIAAVMAVTGPVVTISIARTIGETTGHEPPGAEQGPPA